jgi:hypothetical protein
LTHANPAIGGFQRPVKTYAFRDAEAFTASGSPVPRASAASSQSHAGKIGENLDASRIASKPKEAAAVRELLRPNAFERGAKLGQRIVCRLPIREVGFYEKV